MRDSSFRSVFTCWTLALSLIALGLAPTAAATPARIAKAEDFEGHLQIVGDGVAWSERRCIKGCGEDAFGSTDLARFLLTSPGARPGELARTRLESVPGGSNSVFEDAAFAASLGLASGTPLAGGHVVMVEEEEGTTGDEPYASARVFAGPPGARLTRVARCDQVLLPFALDRDKLAYDETSCAEGSMRIVVRSLEGSSDRSVPAEGATREALALAGDYLAVVSRERGSNPPGELAVWNLATGAKTGSVTVPRGQGVAGLGLLPSGLLAYLLRDPSDDPCARTPLSVLEPGATAPRVLVQEACDDAITVGDEVVTRTENGLEAIPLGGGGARPLLTLGPVLPGGAAARDGRLAYALPTCSGDTTIHLFDLGAAAQDAGTARCPLRIPRQRLRIRTDGRIPVRLRCSRGCAGTLSLFAGRRHFTRRDFERPAGRATVELRAPRGLANRIRTRGGSVRARVETANLQRTGEVLSRTRRLRLHAD